MALPLSYHPSKVEVEKQQNQATDTNHHFNTVSKTVRSTNLSTLNERHWQGHVEVTEGLWNIVHLDSVRQPAAWGQSQPVIGYVFITFLSLGQSNGTHRRCTWGLIAIWLRI
jgi:hypothetical protein